MLERHLAVMSGPVRGTLAQPAYGEPRRRASGYEGCAPSERRDSVCDYQPADGDAREAGVGDA